MRREPINDLVEQIRRSRQCVRAIPARANVAHDPDWVCASERVDWALSSKARLLTPITRVLRILELVGQEAQDPRRIRVRHVDEVKVVVAVPCKAGRISMGTFGRVNLKLTHTSSCSAR